MLHLCSISMHVRRGLAQIKLLTSLLQTVTGFCVRQLMQDSTQRHDSRSKLLLSLCVSVMVVCGDGVLLT
jgi:hypothetical protein